ncbi:20857_t:CDS:2 [Cetraspora pellucida]|uniref:20857_t:CDS:1 n=1 Tax=Cetraspora pellucida TaxID=1433469 RepID=A0A9N9GU95_9GLOM|nr:20857_t:CDS:2 [Cetraspora pellucida]
MTSRNSVFQKFLRKVFIRRRKKTRSRFSRSNKRQNERLAHNNVTNNDNTFRINNLLVNNEEKNEKNYLAPLNFNTPDRTSIGLCRDWRSGNKVIDDLIQLIRLQYPHPAHNLNWIPYEEFVDCEHIADGGFSTIYKATWTTSNQTVALKSLNNSQDISINYLNEIKANWDLFSQSQFLHCHGITQSPSNGDFIMVMQYAQSGDLRLYLQHNSTSSWKDKLRILKQIASGLEELHIRDLVHGNLHSGNIMNIDQSNFVIGDVGLSGPASEPAFSDGIYGVLPYIAPELLMGLDYSDKSDIYSFSIIMWELCSGMKPFCSTPHNLELAKEICEGKRSPIPVGTPPLYSDLMEKCWDSDPSKRPDVADILKTVHHWLVNDSLDVFSRKDGLDPAHNNVSTERTHPDAVYHSRLLDFPELRGTTRRRQYLSLNIPLSVSEGSSSDTIQLSQQPTQPSRDNPKHLLSSGIISNSKSFRNTYNHPPTHKDTREVSRDAQGYEPGRPEIVNPKINPRAINPRVKPGVISVFIPDDDIETLQKYWAMDSTMNFNLNNLKKIAHTV